jgi:hypothetical protein
MGREGRPEGTAGAMRAMQEVIPVFHGGTTLGRAGRGRSLGECILLFLKGKYIVDPFDDEQSFEEAE